MRFQDQSLFESCDENAKRKTKVNWTLGDLVNEYLYLGCLSAMLDHR